MRSAPALLLLLAACAGGREAPARDEVDAADPPPTPLAARDTIALERPVLLGYFLHEGPLSDADGSNSVSDDFGFYLSQAMPAFRAHGADIAAVNDSAVNLRQPDGRVRTLRLRQGTGAVGYWLLRPGRGSVALGEGVMVDADLERLAGDVLGWPEAAGAAVEEFYRAWVGQAFAGAPDERQLAALAPRLADSLRTLLLAARARRDAEARRAPDEKPPFADGDLFSSLFEGPTGFTLEPVDTTRAPLRAPVRLTYAATPKVEWTDTALVVREHERFVVADIVYGGTWSFGNKGSLRDVLERSLR